jgi:hypothetical protein
VGEPGGALDADGRKSPTYLIGGSRPGETKDEGRDWEHVCVNFPWIRKNVCSTTEGKY